MENQGDQNFSKLRHHVGLQNPSKIRHWLQECGNQTILENWYLWKGCQVTYYISFIHSFIPFCPTPLAFQGYCPTTHYTIFPCQCQILIKNNNNKNKQTNLYYLKTLSRNHYKKTFRTSRKFSESSYYWRS